MHRYFLLMISLVLPCVAAIVSSALAARRRAPNPEIFDGKIEPGSSH